MSIFGKRKRRVNPDDDAKYWCMAEDDKKHCLEKRYINDVIGFGVYSTKTFTKGSFILEYAGERRKAKEFEMKKEEKQTYVFHYKWNGEQYVIDATHSLDRLGRYVNDEAFGKPANNSVVKLKMINKQPRLCLFASRDIYEGEEIRYDYGDQEAPWRQEQIDASHEKSSSSQPLVMVTSCLDIKQIRSVRMLDNVKVKQLNNFDESVTHVIVNTDSGERICNRSMKFFYAVAFHCWILSYDWILHSLEAGHYLPEEDYEIIGDLASERKHGGPKKSRQLRNKLLNDLEIYVDERETNEVSRASLELLTKKCGCVVKASLQELNKKSVVITCDAAENVSAEEIKKFQVLYNTKGILTVSRDWLFDTLTDYNIQPYDKYLVIELKRQKDMLIYSPDTEGSEDMRVEDVDVDMQDEDGESRRSEGEMANDGNNASKNPEILIENSPDTEDSEDLRVDDVDVGRQVEDGESRRSEGEMANDENNASKNPEILIENSPDSEDMGVEDVDVDMQVEDGESRGPEGELDDDGDNASKNPEILIENLPDTEDSEDLRVEDVDVDMQDEDGESRRSEGELPNDGKNASKNPKILIENSPCTKDSEDLRVEDVDMQVEDGESRGSEGELADDGDNASKNPEILIENWNCESKRNEEMLCLSPVDLDLDEEDFETNRNDMYPENILESPPIYLDVQSENDDDDDIRDPDFEVSKSELDSQVLSDSTDSESEMSEIVPVPIKFDKKHLKQKISTISQNEDIKVQPSNNKTGVRVWDKLHFCLYCENSYTNITKHYLGRHKDETEIQRILAMKLGSKERKSALLKIRNSGDYKHNTDVLEKGSGTVITWTRKEEKTSHSNYLPCEDCLGFFLKANLWRHRKQCPFKKTDVVGANKRCQSQASLLLPSSIGVCTGLKEKVLSRMSTDEVTMVVRNDPIIIRVGEKLFQKHGQLPHLYSHISQKMRELGRFLLSVRKEDPETSTISKLLIPEKYPLAVKATQSLCGYGNKDNTYSNPSLALKIGHLLKKCCKVKIYMALISRTETNDAEKFCRLCEEYWEDDVSNAALQTLRTEKRSKGNILPLTEDIRKVQNLLKEKSRSMAEKLSKSFTKAGWDTLNQATLASLVIFNRRRGGETERITVDNYRNVKLKHTADSVKEVEEALSPVEKVMCRTFQRIEIRGKKGRTVPVLLPPNLREHIEVLLQHRQEAGVHKDNKYLFPRSSFDSLNPLRSADCLRRFANEADLSFPENLTSTKLRKHVATISQVLDLSKSDLENMANFLGHDIEVHRSFYRIPQETLQVAKMGRLLTAFDNGTVSKYSGKPLDEIPVDEEWEVDDEADPLEDTFDDAEETMETSSYNAASSSSHEPQSSRSQQSSQEPQSSRSQQSSQEPQSSRSQQSSQEQQASTSDSSSSHEPQSSRSPQSSQEPQSSRSQQSSQEPKASRRVILSKEQTTTLKNIFRENILLRKELRRDQCERAAGQSPCLQNLGWKKIKNTIHNWITCEKRKMMAFSKKKK